MRKTLLFLYLLSLGSIAAYGQTRLTQDPELERQLHESGLVHQPLPLNIEHSFEANGWKKEVLQSAPLTRSAGTEGWSHSGAGSMSFSTEKTVSGKGSIKLHRTLDRHGAAGQDCGNGCDREADKQDSVLVLLPFG